MDGHSQELLVLALAMCAAGTLTSLVRTLAAHWHKPGTPELETF
jgi:hypothetical protein